MSKIYFMQMQGGGEYIKIGQSNDPRKRLSAINTGNPYKVVLLGTSPELEESEVHDRFASCNVSGEWFEPSDELLRFIRVHCKSDMDWGIPNEMTSISINSYFEQSQHIDFAQIQGFVSCLVRQLPIFTFKGNANVLRCDMLGYRYSNGYFSFEPELYEEAKVAIDAKMSESRRLKHDLYPEKAHLAIQKITSKLTSLGWKFSINRVGTLGYVSCGWEISK